MENTELIQGLYGSQVSMRRVVGFCTYHRAALTAKTLKRHQCLKRQCNALQKREEHDFWRQHEQKKQLKKASKHSYANYGIQAVSV